MSTVKELATIMDEEEISREEVSLREEREARDYLEGLKKFIECDKDTLLPMTSLAMSKISEKKGPSKYWDVYWTLQKIVKSDEWTADLAKERTEKFDGLEDRIENLQSRCAEIKEFYNTDGFDFFYQTAAKEPPQEEIAVPEELEDDSKEDDEVPRRHTFSARENEPREDAADVPRSLSCSSVPAAKSPAPHLAQVQVKSSLVVLEEDLETGLVVIGRSALLQRKQSAEINDAKTVPKLSLERDDSDEGEVTKVCSPPPPPSFRN